MTSTSGFFLHHGNDLPMLAHALGQRLAGPNKSDWFQPDTILIPQPSMQRWLQNSLAEQFGIAANLVFQLPGQLIDQAMQPWLPMQDGERLLSIERMRWRIFMLLDDSAVVNGPAFGSINRFLQAPDRQLRAWRLAGELAQAFERYQAWRREWLLEWHESVDHNDWQSILWHLASQGRTFRAQAVEAYFSALQSPDCPRPPGLPDRLFIFACQNLSPDVLGILQSFGRWIRVEFFLHNPCEAYWGDAGQRLTGPDILNTVDDNPLLNLWGYAGRDFVAGLLSEQHAAWLGEADYYRNPAHTGNPTLLQALQSDVLNREAPFPDRHSALAADDSIQIHCCAGALREVQMLRAQLLALLQQDPGLQWRDIAIMAPDLERFAPFFAPVFGQSDADYPALPFVLSESSATEATSLHDLFFQLLSLPHSRFTINEGLELLAHPAMARIFGLSSEDLTRLHFWLDQAGVRWGLDSGHRQAVDGVSQVAFTWRQGLQRLLYGYASNDGLIEDTAPVSLPSGKDLHLLDALMAFVSRIESLRETLLQPHMAADWQSMLQSTVAWLAEAGMPAEQDRDFHETLNQLLERLPAMAAGAGLAQPFNSDVVAAWLSEALAPRLGQAWLSGRITVCKMVPMRLIPFKVICLIGMDEGAFPRQEPVAAINRLNGKTLKPRPGDRSNRNDDRFLMLQLLSSCQSHWLISYSGLDPADGSERPPAVVVQELLQTLAAYSHGCSREGIGAFIIRHPIHAFEAPADERIAVLRAISESPSPMPSDRPLFADIADLDAPVDFSLPADIALEQFIAFWKKPMESTGRRMGIRFQLRNDALDEAEPFGKATGLERYHLAQAILEHTLADPNGSHEALFHRLQAEGVLAAGRLGRNRFFGLLAEIQPALTTLTGEIQHPEHHTLEHRHGHLRLHGTLVQHYRSGLLIHALHKTEQTPKLKVVAGLQALLAKAAGLDIGIGVQTAGKTHRVELPYTQAQASAYLDLLLEYYLAGQRGIVCFEPDTSMAWYAFRKKNPDCSVYVWLEQQAADEKHFERRSPGLNDVLTEGQGFLRAVALLNPERFDAVSHSVCSILCGEAS